MRYLSVCSGVEAASVAWEHLGWTPVGFSEIEPFPSAVLKHRFPSVPNFGDMTKYKEWDIEPGTVDVLVGGTPCQSFSVAGLRKGLDDPRGNLMLVYLGLAEHFRVPWLVWENVPGVLSSDGGRDFGTFLGALGELGYRWSFRVLDAQYFGVPQRRRRVFVVAHLGDRGDPAKVLFEPESLRGDSAKSGKARKGSPRGARQGAENGGRVGVDIVGTLCSDTHPGAYSGQDAYTGRLVPQFFDEQASGSQYGTSGVASTCSRRDHKDATDLVVTATGPVTHALTVSDGATEDGTGRGTPIVLAIAFHPTQDPISSVEVTHAMGTGSRQGTATVAVAFTAGNLARGAGPAPSETTVGTLLSQNGRTRTDQDPLVATVTGTLSSRSSAGGGLGTDFEIAGGLQPTTQGKMSCRRLIPIETERLQGFPDNWTLIPWKGKPASECPDGPRYKAMGNSFAVPVVRWIGERLDAVAKGKHG